MLARSGVNKAQIQEAAPEGITGLQYTYSGPLPHPEILEHYDRIVPGGAERIFRQFESQAAHRQRIETKVIQANIFAQIFGALSALFLGGLAIGGGLFLVHEGKGVEGFGAFFAGLASLVSVYIYGRKSQSEERKTKQG